MNTAKLLNTTLATALIAIAAFGATAAMAGTGETDGDTSTPTTPVTSSRSRADVRTELVAALHSPAGLVVGQASQLNPVALANPAFASLRSRAEVKAEVLAARAAGTLDRAGEAQHPEHPLNRAASHRTLASLQR